MKHNLDEIKKRHPAHLADSIQGAHDAIAAATDQTPLGRLRAFTAYEAALLAKMASDPNFSEQQLIDGFVATGKELSTILDWIHNGVE